MWRLGPFAIVLLGAVLGACSEGHVPGRADAGSPRDASTTTDAAIDPDDDAGSDADGGESAVDPECRAPSSSGLADTVQLALEAPAQPPVGVPFVVAVSSAPDVSGDVVLCLDGRVAAKVHIYHGRGSATLQLDSRGTRALVARSSIGHADLTLSAEPRPSRRLGGALTGADLLWDDGSDVIVSGDARVAAGDALRVGPGTRVLLEENAALVIEGELSVEGTAERPVLFTRAGEAPWGGLRFESGAQGGLTHAWLTGGGGDESRKYGHSDSQPLIWMDHARVTFEHGGIVDNTGKGLGSSAAQFRLRDALLSRCDTGGQLNSSEVLIEHSHVLEMPDADGEFDDDDNDGLYLLGAAKDADGKPILSIVRDSVFAVGEDDAIDHNNAEVRVERVWIEGFRHEGVAASVGNTISVVDSVVRGCGQGIEAGYGSPTVVVEHSLVTDNGVGLRVGDSYDWDTSGTLTVRHSIAYGNREANVRNYVKQLKGPLDGALHIECSLIDDPAYHDDANGNLQGQPSGLDLRERGCASGPAFSAECDGEVPGPQTCFF